MDPYGVVSDKKLAALPRLLPQNATGVFKDSYLHDFFDLPQRHSEADLQTSLLRNLRIPYGTRRRLCLCRRKGARAGGHLSGPFPAPQPPALKIHTVGFLKFFFV